MSDFQPQSPDEEERQSRRVKTKLKRIKAYQDLFNTPLGNIVLKDMMRAHGMWNPHPAETQQMAIKEGERAVLLRILTFLKINPTELIERIGDDESV